MIINPISKGGKGLLPEIIVTAPSGSTLDLMQNSVVLQTYTLSSTETQHTFTVKSTGTYTVRGTSGSNTASAEVVVDAIGQFSCTIEYSNELRLYWLGDECEDVTGGWGYAWAMAGYTSGFVTKNSDNITHGDQSSSGYGTPYLFTTNLIDVTRYNSLHCIVDVTSNYNSNSSYKNVVGIGYSTSKQTQGAEVVNVNGENKADYTLSNGETFTGKELTLDISSINTPISILHWAFSHYFSSDRITAVLHKVWLE